MHEPDFRTKTIGRYAGGQFFASVTATLGDGPGHGTVTNAGTPCCSASTPAGCTGSDI